MDLETFERLLTPPGQDLLAEIAAAPPGTDRLALGTRLRKTHPHDLVAAAMTQNNLRTRATAKFGADAAWLYFTPDALEQATRRRVAGHRAQRLAASGTEAVLDLGCGIGADLIAFSRAGLRVRGVERDPVRAAIATANLRALSLDGEVITGDATDTPLRAGETAFVDPARRTGRGRVFGTADLQPPWPWVRDLLAGRAVAKVMPGLAHADIPEGVEAEWVSDGGDLVECCLWGSAFARTRRRATLLPSGASLAHRDEPAVTGEVGAYLYEPDDAVIRAGLVAELAAELGGWLPDAKIAYLSADRGDATALARRFTVVAELPFREKQLRAALQQRRIGTLTVKKRGVQIVPEELIRRLRLDGPHQATVILTRVAGAGRAFLVDPLQN
ncbi:MAG: class I SAM-dependent methyltransferase [Aeromicrobium sp.]|uniref:class I SAM-dependent methyltransferase n=1 Tax=Aeromicrobium sp. TaxID=1871063 RepID=UPI0039E39ED8